jgi:hypothetical protein
MQQHNDTQAGIVALVFAKTLLTVEPEPTQPSTGKLPVLLEDIFAQNEPLKEPSTRYLDSNGSTARVLELTMQLRHSPSLADCTKATQHPTLVQLQEQNDCKIVMQTT